MADMIARLKVDSSEYDAKIKRAAQGLQHFVNTCHEQGDVIGRVLGDTRKYVESLGNMGTVATTVRGRIAELTSGFIEIKSVYNSLSEEEKNAPFGKELSKQLDIMKGRITDAKKELADINKELEQTDTDGKNLGGVIDKLAGKFGLSTKALTTCGSAIGAGTAALKVAKDAFMNSESGIDEWGRTVAGAESIYSTFLNTLNGGNWSDFFANLSDAVQGARDLYDAFDRLNSIKANNAVAIAMAQAEIQQLRILKQQGQDVDDKIKAATARLAALQNQGVQAGINAGKQSVTTTLRNAINSTDGGRGLFSNKTIDYVAEKLATQGQSAFDNAKKVYQDLGRQALDTRTKTRVTGSGNVYVYEEQFTNLNKLTAEQRKQYILAKAITEKETEIQKGTAQWAQSVQEQTSVNREQFRGNRYALTSAGGGNSVKTYDEGIKLGKGMEGLTGATIVTYESMEDLQRQLNAYKTALNRATNAIDEQAARQGIAATEWKMSDVGRSAAKLGWSQEDMTSVAEEMQNSLYSKLEPVKIDFAVNTDSMEDVVEEVTDNTKEMANAWNDAGTAIKNVGSLLSQIEDPAAKVAGIIAEAVASIALTFAQSLKGTVTPWDWIAGAASGTATMISTIAAIKSATSGYANGGIVQGTSRTGDNNLIRANAGELILTEGQQGTIAKTLVKAKEGYNIEFGTLTNIATEIANLVGEINLTLNTKILEALNKVQDYTEVTSTWAIIGALMPFAHGGIVHAANGFIGGNRYSTDDIPVMVSSGELILNRAQQGALAADLQRNDQHGAAAQPYVSGEQIYLGLNNYLKRSGRGEILTSRG